MDTALWAGRRRQGESARICLSVTLRQETTGQEFTYAVEIGLVPQAGAEIYGAAFRREPQVKAERLTVRTGGRTAVILDRDGRTGFVRDADGRRHSLGSDLLATETALGGLLDATGQPEIALTRQAMTAWRFHHGFRTDAESPLRRPCLAVTTPTLASDGSDLAAVFATLTPHSAGHGRPRRGGGRRLPRGAARRAGAGPGGELRPDGAGLRRPGLRRAGTVGRDPALPRPRRALLGYRLPPFIAPNEPETSLHPDLMDPLARLIARAAERTQVWLVTHSERLAADIAQHGGAQPRTVIKRDGETWIAGLKLSGAFAEKNEE